MTDEKNEFGIGEFGGQFSSGQVSDVKTIIDDILKQTGTNTTSDNNRAVALSFLNQNYLTILKGRHWRFLNKELFIELDAPYTLGSVNLVDGDHEVTEYIAAGGVSVLNWNANHVGLAFCPKSTDGGLYRIDQVESSNRMVILPGYAGASTTIGTSYQILNDRYLLDAKVQDIKSVTPMGFQEMRPIGLQQFRTMKGDDPCRVGTPLYYTIFATDEQAGQITMEVYPAPDKRYAFHVEYNERVTRLEDSGSCYTAIPPEHTDVLILSTRASVYQDQNNVVLASEVRKEALSAWARMAGDQSMTDSRARFQPGRDYFHRRRNSRVSLGLKYFGKFD